jgi:hypothetical protein
MEKDNHVKWFFASISICFIARFLYCYLWGWETIPEGSDGVSYNSYALAIVNSMDWLTNPIFYGNYREPVYPFFLASVYSVFGQENFFAVYFMQIGINLLTIYYIYKISMIIFDYRTALLSSIFSGTYIYYYYYSGTILRETIIQFLLIFLFYHIYFFVFKKSKITLRSKEFWVVLGTFFLLTHTDAKYLFYTPFIFFLFFLNTNRFSAIKLSLQFIIILAVIMSPWMVRNYVAYDRIVLINTRTLDKYLNKMLTRNDSKTTAISADRKADSLYSGESERNPGDYAPSEEERVMIKAGLNPYKRPAEEIELVKNDVYPPSTFLGKAFARAQEMWWPFRFSYDYNNFPPRLRGPYSFEHNIVSAVFYFPLLVFFFYGFLSIVLSKNWHGLFLLYPVLIHAILHFFALAGRDRHRIQIDAFIIIIATYGFSYMINQIKFKRFAHTQ